jgi:hypothetical protein
VKSSNIKEVKYNAKKKTFTVDFLSGSQYEYADVPKEVNDAFKLAVKKKESVGQLFSSMVREKFKFTKIK